jgi:hypothetical protein
LDFSYQKYQYLGHKAMLRLLYAESKGVTLASLQRIGDVAVGFETQRAFRVR